MREGETVTVRLIEDDVVLALVHGVRCRMCRAWAGRPCRRAGPGDRTSGWRKTNPHRLRILDATRDL